MIKTPVYYRIDSENMYDSKGGFIAHISKLDVATDMKNRINMHNKLMRALCDIQQMCIGDIAMGYKLEAETICQLISAATGLTAPELLEKCK